MTNFNLPMLPGSGLKVCCGWVIVSKPIILISFNQADQKNLMQLLNTAKLRIIKDLSWCNLFTMGTVK